MTRRLFTFMLTAFTALLGLIWVAGPAQAQSVICKTSAIPAGQVIIADTTNFSCPGKSPNAWVIDTPNPSGTTVCTVSPIPPGYVIVGQGSSPFCPNFPNNTWVIRRP